MAFNPIKDDIWYSNKTDKPYKILRVFRKGNAISSIEITDETETVKHSLTENEFREKFRFYQYREEAFL